MKKSQTMLASLIFVNFFLYGLNTLYSSFVPRYISNSVSNEIIVGILLSIGPVVSIFSPLFWGKVADKAKYKNNTLIFIILFSALFFSLLLFSRSVVVLAALLTAIMFFMSPFNGIGDTITLEYSYTSGVKYGPIRVMGTLGFGLLALFTGLLNKNNSNSFIFVYLATSLLLLFLLKTSPQIKGHPEQRKQLSLKPIFRDRTLILLSLFTMLHLFTLTVYNNFYPDYLKEVLGKGDDIWGLLVFITVLGEIPFFFLFDKIFQKFSLKQLVLIGTAIGTFRYAALLFVTDTVLIGVVALLTGFTPALITYCASYYITRNVREELQASAQCVLYAIGFGIGKSLGGVLGGVFERMGGIHTSFLISVVLTACSAVCVLWIKTDRKEDMKQ